MNKYPYATRYAPPEQPKGCVGVPMTDGRQYVYVAICEDLSLTVAPTKEKLIHALEDDTGGHMLESHPDGGLKDEQGNVVRWQLVWMDSLGTKFDIYISREAIR